MKTFRLIIILLLLLNADGCIIKYTPVINDSVELMVIDGLITDQAGINTITLSKSQPMWKRQFPRPLTRCLVSITDDLGHKYNLKETKITGVYNTDPADFRGVAGRIYTLHVRTTTETVNYSYESLPMKMIPVPPVDSLYYEKKIFIQSRLPVEGCNIYLNTHDPSDNCRFYRWEYSETWEFHLQFNSPLMTNKVCWISNNPAGIMIRNTSLLADATISKLPVVSISDPADRFNVKYSILVNQFSLTEDEYFYWERLKNMTDEAGSLYDIIPADIPNNLFCLEEPDKKILGYFCVSAVSSKRLFIKDKFNYSRPFNDCYSDTIFTSRPDTLPNINELYILADNSKKVPPNIVFTKDRSCFDCTTRGTNIKPAFWDEGK